jgi:hypothetical protein
MSHLEDIGKETYLQQQGFEWIDAYEAFVHRDQWKIFRRDYLEDHSFDSICEKIAEAPMVGRWQIYSNKEADIDLHTIHKHYGATS